MYCSCTSGRWSLPPFITSSSGTHLIIPVTYWPTELQKLTAISEFHSQWDLQIVPICVHKQVHLLNAVCSYKNYFFTLPRTCLTQKNVNSRIIEIEMEKPLHICAAGRLISSGSQSSCIQKYSVNNKMIMNENIKSIAEMKILAAESCSTTSQEMENEKHDTIWWD